MKVRYNLFFLLISSALLLQAFGASTEDAVATAVALRDLQTAAAGGGGRGGGEVATDTPQPPGVPSNTPQPSETPTITLTPTSSTPFVSVADNTNCRTGPSSNYGFVTLITTGVQLEVLKIFNSANYVVIRNPNGPGDCWLWLQYATPANFASYNLPVATQPPTPTPTATATATYIWEGSWTTSIETGGICTMTLSESGNTISGSYTCPGYSGTVSGTLSANRRTVEGTWETLSAGSFVWQRKTVNTNQFVGNWDEGNYWCGARAGASLPDPCFGP